MIGLGIEKFVGASAHLVMETGDLQVVEGRSESRGLRLSVSFLVYE